MIRTVHDIKINASNPLLPLKPWNAFVGSAASIRITDVPRKIGNWVLERLWIDVKYPNDVEISREAKRTNGVYVATIDAATVYGQVGQGYQICASGKDENGDPVDRYVLGVGDVNIMKLDQTSSGPDTVAQWMRIYDTRPDTPRKGDAVIEDGKLKVYDGTAWVESSGATMTSQLTNDAGFITDKQVKPGKTPGYAQNAENVPWEGVSGRPTKLSEFTNDTGFISSSNSPYLPLTGGTLTGDLAVGVERSESRKLTVAAASGAVGITMQGGTSAGGGSRAVIGGSTKEGGVLIVSTGGTSGGSITVLGGLDGGGGGSILVTGNGASISANGTNASIKKGGKEVATETYVTDQVNELNTSVTNSIAKKADKATTLEGYGITDAATKAELTALDAKVETANVKLEGVA